MQDSAGKKSLLSVNSGRPRPPSLATLTLSQLGSQMSYSLLEMHRDSKGHFVLKRDSNGKCPDLLNWSPKEEVAERTAFGPLSIAWVSERNILLRQSPPPPPLSDQKAWGEMADMS